MSHSQQAASSTFEDILERVIKLRRAASSTSRTIQWIGQGRTLAVARDTSGAIEIYLAGEELKANYPDVAAIMRHDLWTDSGGEQFRATRLTLETGRHLDPVGALICNQLLSAGMEEAGQREVAFRESEPIIDLAVKKFAEANSVLIGLAGELYVLRALIRAEPALAVWLVDAWAGYQPSTRDLQLGPLGVEIKTTTGSESTHQIQGTHQVDRGLSVDQVPETDLYLLSIGIQWLPLDDRNGSSIREIIEEITGALPEQHVVEFRRMVNTYGVASVAEPGLSGDAGRRWNRPFFTTFERLYDLADDKIQVLHGDDVAELAHVVASSVTFRVQFPQKVRGEKNPTAGMNKIVHRLLSRIEN